MRPPNSHRKRNRKVRDPQLIMKSLHTEPESRILGAQALLVGIGAAGGFFFGGMQPAFALLCGGVVALINTWLLSRNVARAFANAQASVSGGTLTLFSGLFTRLVIIAMLFGAGFVLLKLSPLPFILGFAVAQIAYAFGGIGALYKTKHY